MSNAKSKAPEAPASSEEKLSVTSEDYSRVDEFALPQDFGGGLGVRDETLHAAVRKPKKTEWFRAHPEYQVPMYSLKIDEQGDKRGELYMVTKAIADLLGEGMTRQVYLVLCVNTVGEPFFWPVAVPDDKENAWHVTAIKALERAKVEWIRLVAKMSLGAYGLKTTTEELEAPVWPEDPRKLLNLALEKRGISDPEHELVTHILKGV